MLLKKQILLYCIGFVALVVVLLCIRFRDSHSAFRAAENDTERYVKEHTMRKTGAVHHHATEERYSVTKCLWLSDKFPRLELEMKGAQSNVAILSSKKNAECTETLSDVHGVVQEELFYMDDKGKEYTILQDGTVQSKEGQLVAMDASTLIPMQRFRTFVADRAVYDYRRNTLVAYGVTFRTYATAGHELIREYEAISPLTTGVASSMTLCHEGTMDSLQFSAENLKMQLGQP